MSAFLPEAYLQRADVLLALKDFAPAKADLARAMRFNEQRTDNRWRTPPGLQGVRIDLQTLEIEDHSIIKVWTRLGTEDSAPADDAPTRFAIDCQHRTVQTLPAGPSTDPPPGSLTLQSFLSRGSGKDQTKPSLYLLDESSLASTKQMRAFLDKIKPTDRVLVIGDTAQHQGVDAGRPFEQMQDAGMRTSQLDQIVRQRKNPALLEAVQHLAKGETAKGIEMLAQQGRITQIADPQERTTAIAKDYAANPERTIVVSPDNRSRQQINEAVRVELRAVGRLGTEQKTFSVLAHRSDMTGADREWAARYKPGDILKYEKGSKEHGIARNSTAVVVSADARNNTVTVQQQGGKPITYDPKRLKGVNAYRETEKEFATGDRIQFTAKDKGLGVSNRDLGTITTLEPGKITVKMDGKLERTIQFDPARMRHFDHGYAVTSHVSQGLTEGRVIANIDTDSARSLINTRLAYVAVSRAEHDARIYTNDAEGLGARLATDISKTSAVNFRRSPEPAPQKPTGVQVQEFADPNHRIAAVALAYGDNQYNTVVISKNPAERRELNQLIRADLQASGLVTTDSKAVSVLVEKGMTNPKLAEQYVPGDVIQYRKGSPSSQGIPDNTSAVVVATDTKNNQLTVRTSNGDRVIYSPHLTKSMTAQSRVYREEIQEFAQGDRVRMTESNATQGVRKGDLGTVTAIGDTLDVRLDKGEGVQLTQEQAKYIEHGYAVESVKTGAPDRVLISQNGAFQATSEAAYLSRTGREVSVYTSEGSAQANAVAPTIALPEQLKPAMPAPTQQQSEAPSNAIAPEQAPVVQHRHTRGR